MKYKGKSIEVISSKTLFGKETVWIHILEDDSFTQVLRSDLDDDGESQSHSNISYIRYVAIASRIKEEMAQKRLLAPYESSLIPLPHQILVLEKVMQGVQTRFLLADEVGMGKTIEAGLILKEKKLRGDVRRTLLVVPKSAMLQWQEELKEHFNESFFIYDSDFITGMARTFAGFKAEEELNFWKQHNQIIVSLDAIKPLQQRQGWGQDKIDEYNKYRIESVVGADFDMVIIDEAHRMGGSTSYVSRFLLAETLCNAVPNVLLLSATPHRGKTDHFCRVMQLVDADAFSDMSVPSIRDIEPYVMRSEKRFAVDYDGKKLFQKRTTVRMDVILDDEIHRLQKALYLHITEYVRFCFGRAKRGNRNATGLVMVMMQKLASSSTAAVLSAMETRLWRIQNGEEQDELQDYDTDYVSDFEDLNMGDYSVDEQGLDAFDEEKKLHELITEARTCLQTERDAKTSALIQKINELKLRDPEGTDKILVFTEFRQTQHYLTKELEKAGFSVIQINGSMELQARQQALVQFKNHADVMIATDAAGESLNMQFCHIVFNYDLPWNPMTIEQRIGRVDRIGQKCPVIAFNMLTDNSVDVRVYQIIVDKLDAILHELGIDKTSDVLDSTIDMKHVNNLYLQSLLDPHRFDFASDSWLYDIKKKLNDYKSTEGLLPAFSEKDIVKESAGEIKYSPLPVWLEDLMDTYTLSEGGKIEKELGGTSRYTLDGHSNKFIFDSSLQTDNPDATQLTLQHPTVQKILDEVDGNSQRSIPVICSQNSDETPGYLTLWKIEAKNPAETKTTYCAQFITDTGKVYGPYGNDIWNQLVQNKSSFHYIEDIENTLNLEDNELLNHNLHTVYLHMEKDILTGVETKVQKKLRSLAFTEQRIDRIGIENIRNAKKKKLEKERAFWTDVFSRSCSVVPDVKNILIVRLNG